MNKTELIAKQQLEIEKLKSQIARYKDACEDVRICLCRPEQWSMKCPDFPEVAIRGIVMAREAISGI